jgi:hypothetical protein
MFRRPRKYAGLIPTDAYLARSHNFEAGLSFLPAENPRLSG